MAPVFSVIVPIYKVEKYLEKCVDSILAQTFSDYELLLVDDGSPDQCPAICDDYAKKDSRVRVIHKPNGGLVSARNTGVHAALGEYICYVDGDDWVAQDLLKVVYHKAVKNYQPDVVVYCGVRQFEDRQELLPQGASEGLYNKERLRSEIYPYMMYDNRQPFCHGLVFPVAWNKVYRRELLLSHYCTETRIRMGEDNAFVYECLYAAENVYFCDDILYYYNQMNSTSMVHSYDIRRFENNQLLTSYIEHRLGGVDSVLDNQINAFKAYWLIMAVFHETKCGRPVSLSATHIKTKIQETKVLEGIRFDGLPMMAQMYLLMLKLHLFRLALIGARIISRKREKA